MILVDTSIWIDHFRHTENSLVQLLNAASLLTHPFVIGELALRHLKHRGEKIDALYFHWPPSKERCVKTGWASFCPLTGAAYNLNNHSRSCAVCSKPRFS
jgi:hypothetical protein